MCYTVVVAKTLCENGHPQIGSGVLCWRLCRFQAEVAINKDRWDDLCTKRERDTKILITSQAQTTVRDDDCAVCADKDDLLQTWKTAIEANMVIEESYKAQIGQLDSDIEDFGDPQLLSAELIVQLQYQLDQRDLVEASLDVVQQELQELRENFQQRRLLISSGRLVQDQAIISANAKVGDLDYYFGSVSHAERVARHAVGRLDWPIHFPLPHSRFRRYIDNFQILDGDELIPSDEEFSEEDDHLYMN